jgi:hypothetical protein
MDITRRNHLLAILKSKPKVAGRGPGPTVSLEDFFEGNDDVGSIGCNLVSHPGIDRFYRTLLEIRSRPDVQDVLVEIRELVDEDSWPFSDTIFVLTSMRGDDLQKLLSNLQPNEVGQFPSQSIPADLPPTAKDMRVLGAWWD